MTTTRHDPARVNMATVVRMRRTGDTVALVISVNPFGPLHLQSAHVQNYHFDRETNRGHLITDSPYRTESAAVAAFDKMHPAIYPRPVGATD